ncbi:hypothetical protein [Bacillus cereus]|uniref:hypothetical protein n=1 Tax=Bacillus cereus TaxID=1396 RepID=UPI003D950EF4
MSTYDGAYGRNTGWAKICSCEDGKVNNWCPYHGKHKNGYDPSLDDEPIEVKLQREKENRERESEWGFLY